MPLSYADAVVDLLASGAGNGELSQTALEVISSRLQDHVRRKFPTLTGAGEDITQDALIRFLRAAAAGRIRQSTGRPGSEGDNRPDSYLLRITDRLCMDLLRRAEKLEDVPAGGEPADYDLASDVAGRVDADTLVRQAIDAALNAGDLTAVAVLQSWKDATHSYREPTLSEIREVSGRSVPTIRAVLKAFRRWCDTGRVAWQRL